MTHLANDLSDKQMARLDDRIALLQSWLATGVPDDLKATLPKSLRQMRLWEVPASGIFAMGSPNKFVKTHPVYGERVSLIEKVLLELREESNSPATGRQKAADRKALEESKQQLIAVTSQWHVAHERQRELQAQVDHLRLINQRLETQIAELKQKYQSQQHLHSVGGAS